MNFNPWYPYASGLLIVVIGSVPAFFIPETLEDAKAKMKPTQNEARNEPFEGIEPPSKRPVLREILRQGREFKKSTRFIWKDVNVCLIILIAGVGFMSRQSTNLLMQYASKKFEWSIGKVCTNRLI